MGPEGGDAGEDRGAGITVGSGEGAGAFSISLTYESDVGGIFGGAEHMKCDAGGIFSTSWLKSAMLGIMCP